MKPNRRADPTRRSLMRVALYYAGLAVVLVLLVRVLPLVRRAVAGAGVPPPAGDLVGRGASQVAGAPLASSPWDQALLALTSMLGALAIMVPVAWIYMLTRGKRGYLESVVHTLLILPVAVTGIVMIVGTNVALAFALAGIVAAVRFRTTLEDTKDAVYVFLAIGVGIASGVQALGIALALSIVFNVVILVLWSTGFGGAAKGRAARAKDLLAGSTALTLGDPTLLGVSGSRAPELAARLQDHLAGEQEKKKSKRADTLLLVHAAVSAPAQRVVEPLLEELSTRWRLVEVGSGPGGFVLAYLARLNGLAVQESLMERLRNGRDGVIAAAELRSLRDAV
ncbi:MAG TPA: DUF4956 domain-containing protein [Longimicrobiales bacterium]|nr:DUF4956 domain-containing protein [Longimicrobiales bacterium]